jgi:hypothetical protein
VEQWLAVSEGQTINWDALFTGYQAIVDIPGQRYYQELMQTYPAAKVILTIRDPSQWYESLKQTIYQAHTQEVVETAWWWLRYPLSPQRKKKVLLGRLIGKILWDDYFQRRFEDKDFAINVYENHLKAVQQQVPADKLLIFDVADGWQPLCDFLGMPIPREEPFPHVNDTAFFRQFWQKDILPTGKISEKINIIQQIIQNCAEYPHKIALIYNDISLSYGELHTRINQIAHLLYSLDLKVGDRVALHLPNCPEFVTGYLGIHQAGGVVITVNTALTRNEINHIPLYAQ